MEEFDVVVVGAGHAGIEAALASARRGMHTILFTLNIDSIANLPCNPSIGGTAKGHLVREVDALGGFMAIAADHTMIQSRMLNRGKGVAVQSLRNQTDRTLYHRFAKNTLENQNKLRIIQDEVVDLLLKENKIIGIKTRLGFEFACKTVVLACGTYLNAQIHVGENCCSSGPDNSRPAAALTAQLVENGIPTRRFKTGTPARVHKNSIDYSKLMVQKGDENISPFSFLTENILGNKCVCYIAYTNNKTHSIIQKNIEKSAIYSGNIQGVGPRYCPSIEDKIVRFPDKDRHQIFVEPCGLDTQEMYLQGMSSSLPVDVQEEMYRSIEGFEHLQIIRPAYAIEYDCIDPTQLYPTLESKIISGLFMAGQLCGTSGYEEAAAQGILAGINAVNYCRNKEPLTLPRTGSYIGTLIDDIVTKGVLDPYRMMTSRSEHRLFLRQDNADERLTPVGREAGLVDDFRWNKFSKKMEIKYKEIMRLKQTLVRPQECRAYLESLGYLPLEQPISAEQLLKRPKVSYSQLAELIGPNPEVTAALEEQIEADIKYEGYIKKQQERISQLAKREERPIPKDLDYSALAGMRLEAREKLAKIQPATVGQAARIPGVTPNDIDQLCVYLKVCMKMGESGKNAVESDVE